MAIKAAQPGGIAPESELGHWLAWAEAHAAAIDPLGQLVPA